MGSAEVDSFIFDNAVIEAWNSRKPGAVSWGRGYDVPCPSQCTEGVSFVSADYWHETRCEIRKRHGGELFILPQCSAAGDQAPRPMIVEQQVKDIDTLFLK